MSVTSDMVRSFNRFRDSFSHLIRHIQDLLDVRKVASLSNDTEVLYAVINDMEALTSLTQEMIDKLHVQLNPEVVVPDDEIPF